ncbi:MAG: hypothetical protein JRD93_15690 [Deltaproteobacteria bacterium]|nr:hypothetical protein [Deltaproteobacteria bacterium]
MAGNQNSCKEQGNAIHPPCVETSSLLTCGSASYIQIYVILTIVLDIMSCMQLYFGPILLRYISTRGCKSPVLSFEVNNLARFLLYVTYHNSFFCLAEAVQHFQEFYRSIASVPVHLEIAGGQKKLPNRNQITYRSRPVVGMPA